MFNAYIMPHFLLIGIQTVIANSTSTCYPRKCSEMLPWTPENRVASITSVAAVSVHQMHVLPSAARSSKKWNYKSLLAVMSVLDIEPGLLEDQQVFLTTRP